VNATAAAKTQEKEAPKAQLFSLKAPYMKQGRVTQLAAKTTNLWIHAKVNAEGGENEVHTHLDEDHAFVVLEGRMSVFDEKGNEMVVKPYQGVMLPKGAYYRYLNTGAGNLVVLRVGAAAGKQEGNHMRVRPDGRPILGDSVDNKTLPPIEMPGKFFAESSGLEE
jgi:mannose-6-phosphate isomerase-like protein (cupin superfamily)